MFSKLTQKKKLIVAAVSFGIAASQLIIPPAQASRWYQERDGVFGEIKYIRVCNHASAIQYKVIAEASSRTNRVKWVNFKMYSSFYLGFNWRGWPLAWNVSPRWVDISNGAKYNHRSGDRRWYETRGYWYLMSGASQAPFKFAIHVAHTGGTTIDLGTIVNMGNIPVGECRQYDDGNFQYY